MTLTVRAATSSDTGSRPLKPDTCIFPGEPISEIHASSPGVELAGIIARANACSIGPERSNIEFVRSEELRRRWRRWRNNLLRFRFSGKNGYCLRRKSQYG